MILSDPTTLTYSKLCKYVTHYLPIYERTIPKRFCIYLKHCGDDALGRRAVKYDDGPVLKVRDTSKLLPSGEKANGFFWATLSKADLYLDVENAKKFDGDPQKYELCLQYLLLHESIHWARHHAGLSASIDGDEAGDSFEVKAYGQDVSYTWDKGARRHSNLKL